MREVRLDTSQLPESPVEPVRPLTVGRIAFAVFLGMWSFAITLGAAIAIHDRFFV